MFFLKGSDDQVEYAKQLIYEKITGVPGSYPPPGYFEDGGQSGGSAGGAGPGHANGTAAAASAANPWSAYTDPNAAWSAYYQQYYQAAAGATPAAAAPAATPAAAPTAANGAQPDYTQAWVDYYRQMGMHEQAEAILKQQQSNGTAENGKSPADQTNGTAGGKHAAQTNGNTVAPAPAGAEDPYAQWAQYAQYQQYANYYQQQHQQPQPPAEK
jgi:hypothetical protein